MNSAFTSARLRVKDERVGRTYEASTSPTCSCPVDYHVPFGGRKGSSYGSREQGRYAAEFYTTIKTAYTQA